MPRNKLTDLNDHLFSQLERLNDDELTDQQLALEVQRARAISQLSTQVIKNAKVTLDAMKLLHTGDIAHTPKFIEDTTSLK